MKLKNETKWFLPVNLEALDLVFAREFLASDVILKKVGLKIRKKFQNFNEDPTSLLLFNRCLNSSFFQSDDAKLCWLCFSNEFIKSNHKEEEIIDEKADLQIIHLKAPLFITLKNCTIYFASKDTQDSVATSNDPTIKLKSKYSKVFKVINPDEYAGCVSSIESPKPINSNENETDSYAKEIRELNRFKGMVYGSLISKVFYYTPEEIFLLNRISEIRDSISSINTDYEMANRKGSRGSDEKVNQLFKLAQNKKKHNESWPECFKSFELRNAEDPSATLSRIQYKKDISFSELVPDLHRMEELIEKHTDIGAMVQSAGGKLDDFLKNITIAKDKRIRGCRELEIETAIKGTSLFKKINDVLKDHGEDLHGSKLNVQIKKNITESLLKETEQNELEFLKMIQAFFENGTPIKNESTWPKEMIALHYFLDIGSNLSKLVKFFSTRIDDHDFRWMTFAYWGSYYGFTKLTFDFTDPLFKNLKSVHLESIDEFCHREMFQFIKAPKQDPEEIEAQEFSENKDRSKSVKENSRIVKNTPKDEPIEKEESKPKSSNPSDKKDSKSKDLSSEVQQDKKKGKADGKPKPHETGELGLKYS